MRNPDARKRLSISQSGEESTPAKRTTQSIRISENVDHSDPIYASARDEAVKQAPGNSPHENPGRKRKSGDDAAAEDAPGPPKPWPKTFAV